MCLLWPMTTPGKRGSLTPVTSYRGALTATWNQADAIGSGKAAEPASIVPPPATFAPCRAEPLLAAQWLPACPYGRFLVAARTETAARATAAEGWLAMVAVARATAGRGWSAVLGAATPVPLASACRAPVIVFVGPATAGGPVESGIIPRVR